MNLKFENYVIKKHKFYDTIITVLALIVSIAIFILFGLYVTHLDKVQDMEKEIKELQQFRKEVNYRIEFENSDKRCDVE